MSFLGTKLKSETNFNDVSDGPKCLLRLLFGRTYDDEVIGVTNELVASSIESPVQLIKDNIRDQG